QRHRMGDADPGRAVVDQSAVAGDAGALHAHRPIAGPDPARAAAHGRPGFLAPDPAGDRTGRHDGGAAPGVLGLRAVAERRPYSGTTRVGPPPLINCTRCPEDSGTSSACAITRVSPLSRRTVISSPLVLAAVFSIVLPAKPP